MAVAVYPTPTMVVSSLLCVRCRRLGRLADAGQEDLEEAALAEALLGQAERYCAAVALRDASLQAADRYYHALMEYQWRLNALDVQLHAVEAAGGGAELPAAGAEEQQRRRAALDQCLTDIQREHALAISALEERASHYAVSIPAAAAVSLDRIAASEAERLAAVESYRRLAGETFRGAAREAEELLEARGEEGLQRLRFSLERRRGFWHSELDDTWAAWRDVTEAMHRAGDEAVAAWEELSSELASGRPRAVLRRGNARPELRRALAAFAARALEVELLSSPALSGLCPERALAEEGSEDSSRSPSSAAARLSLLSSVLELLRGLAALHEVGDALLSQDNASAASCAGFGSGRPAPGRSLGPEEPPRPAAEAGEEAAASSSSSSSGLGALEATPTAGAAVRLAAAVQVTPAAAAGRLAATPEEGQGVCSLLPWLAECLVEALCEAARQHDREKVQTIIRLCHSLGRSGLADAICGAAARKRALRSGGLQQARGGSTPLLTSLEELAAAEGGASGGGGGEKEREGCPCPRKCGRHCCGLPEQEDSARKPEPVPAA